MAAVVISPRPRAHSRVRPNSSGSGQFVMKFDGAGKTLYATYLGGVVRIDRADSQWTAMGMFISLGATASNDFPTLHAFQATLTAQEDVFIAALNATGTALIYSTYWGGAWMTTVGIDRGRRHEECVHHRRNFYNGFPDSFATAGCIAGGAFVTKLDPSGMPIYSLTWGRAGRFGGGRYHRRP